MVALARAPWLPPAGAATALLSAPPKVRHTERAEADIHARTADRVTVHHPDGDVAAVIGIASRGNKESRHALAAFAAEVGAFLDAGVHVLVVDLLPPDPRTPRGSTPPSGPTGATTRSGCRRTSR